MPKSAKPAAKLQTTKAAPELPEWLVETPLDTDYWLLMHQGGIDTDRCQEIELSRREYLLIKVFLAKLRGLVAPTAKPEGFIESGNSLPKLWEELTPEEIAAVPETAHANKEAA